MGREGRAPAGAGPHRAHAAPRRTLILTRYACTVHEAGAGRLRCLGDRLPTPACPPPPRPRGRGGARRRVRHPRGCHMNKAFLPLAGRSIASWGLNTLGSVEGVGLLVFVVRPEDLEHARFVAGRETDHRLEIITGGDTRQESELLALRHLADRIDSGAVDTVLIHDAARPLVSHGRAAAVLHAAREAGGAVPGIPADDLAPVEEIGRASCRGGGWR